MTPSCAKHLNDHARLDGLCRTLIKELDFVIVEGPRLQGGLEALSGMVLLRTGHIAIHTYTTQRRFSLDIFSKSKFSRTKAEEVTSDVLGVSQRWVRYVERQWPV